MKDIKLMSKEEKNMYRTLITLHMVSTGLLILIILMIL